MTTPRAVYAGPPGMHPAVKWLLIGAFAYFAAHFICAVLT